MDDGQPKGSGSTWSTLLRGNSLAVVWMTGASLYAGDFLIKRIPLWRDPLDVWVPFDDIFPFLPAWAFIYIYAWLGLIFGLAGWYVWENRSDWEKVRALLIAAVVMQVSGWLVHYLIPTTFPRPELAAELVGNSLIWQIYSTDPPTHVLPSLHMASVTVGAWFFCRYGSRWRHLVGVGAIVLISLSVMYTKQHGVVDVVAGVLWGWAAVAVGIRVSRALARQHEGSPIRHHASAADRPARRPAAPGTLAGTRSDWGPQTRSPAS
jgi:membrane-associated phospholipid phosphatase